MQPSFMRTITAPGSPTTNPARLANATDVPVRLVLNPIISAPATAAAYAYSISDLTPGISSEAFRDTGVGLIVILAPRQTLYVVGVGGQIAVSVAASEAYPVL